MQHPATEFVSDAEDTLRVALSSVHDSLMPRPDLDQFVTEALDSAVKLLGEARDHLQGARAGDSLAVAEAMRCVRQASNAIDSTRGLVRWLPAEVVYARADALRLLDSVTGRW